VYIPVRLAGGRFVDVNAFPSIALNRIEVVKEGASAVYGSDAVTGVVNFLTRGDFEGLEVTGSHECFSGAEETNVGAIWGSALGERAHAVVSAEAFFTRELGTEERK
jgi:iron complex outermembrane receptor protein